MLALVLAVGSAGLLLPNSESAAPTVLVQSSSQGHSFCNAADPALLPPLGENVVKRQMGNICDNGAGQWRPAFTAQAKGNAYDLAQFGDTCGCSDGFVTVSEELNGHSYQVCPWAEDQGVSKTLKSFGRWEFKQNLMNSILSKASNRLVVNVGAHVGYFALMSAAYGHRVMAFEPVPFHSMRIAAAASQNKFWDQLTLYQNAVGAGSGLVNITVDPSNSGASGVGFNAQAKYTLTGINMVKLDDMGIAEAPLLLMIDSEGHESKVMYGAWQTVQQQRPDFILMEVSVGDFNQKKPCNSQEMAQSIMALGYSVHDAEACDHVSGDWSKCQVADLAAAVQGKSDHLDTLFVKK